MWDGAVAGDRFVQEFLGQRRVLTGGDDPAWVVAGVDVDQDVQVEPDALGRVGGLGASFSGLPCGCSDPVHARQGAPVPALVQLADPRPIERSAFPTVFSTPR